MLEGPAVLLIQKVLARLGYKVFLDGIWGPQTWSAIAALIGKNTLLFSKVIKLVSDILKQHLKTSNNQEEKNLIKQILESSDADEVERLIKKYKKNQKTQRMKKSTETRRPKEGKPETATATVLQLIKRSQDGITTTALSQETGFDTKKIQNIVYRLKKQKKIKNLGRGVYGAA